MTHPTKAIYGTLLKDFVKLGNVRATEEQLFSDEDLRNSLPRIDVIDFHQTEEIKGIKVGCNVLRACMGSCLQTTLSGRIFIAHTPSLLCSHCN